MSTYRNEATDRLFRVISALRTPEECEHLFEDLCTIKEILDMSQRLETAIMLDHGCSYQEIADKVNISSATISRVKRALSYGSNGYRVAIDRMTESEEQTHD